MSHLKPVITYDDRPFELLALPLLIGPDGTKNIKKQHPRRDDWSCAAGPPKMSDEDLPGLRVSPRATMGPRGLPGPGDEHPFSEDFRMDGLDCFRLILVWMGCIDEPP